MTISEQIADCERRLTAALISSDVPALDALLHDQLLFATPDGSAITKAIDLATHRTGDLRVETFDVLELTVNIIDDTTAVAATLAKTVGRFREQVMSGRLRYIRVWRQTSSGWQVVGGSCTKT